MYINILSEIFTHKKEDKKNPINTKLKTNKINPESITKSLLKLSYTLGKEFLVSMC